MRLRVLSLALLIGVRIQRCRELWCRFQTRLGGLDPALLWLWCRPVRPLAWESPYTAGGGALEKAKRQKIKNKKIKKIIIPLWTQLSTLKSFQYYLKHPIYSESQKGISDTTLALWNWKVTQKYPFLVNIGKRSAQ